MLILTAGSASAQISGTVFRDFNASGTRETPGEIGVGGVTITVTGANGVVNTVTSSSVTASLGTYSVSPTGTAPYRVQFSNLPLGYFTGPVGSGSGSTLQFVASATTANVNLGINYPADYSQANPFYLVPCYVNGDPTSTTGNSGSQGVLVTLPYNSTGNAPAEFAISLNSQIGTVFGIAYQRVAKHAYTGAFVKRHSGLGPGGAGAIYLTRPTNAALTSFTSTVFTTLPIAVTVASNSVRSLPGSTTVLNQDATTFGQVGKTGLGDLEMSEDGTQLYAVNLSDQKLYRIPINNPTSANPTANTAGITSFSITGSASVCRTNSVFRPFALKGYRNKMYIGGVCTNESVPTSTTINFGSGSTPGNLYTRDTTGMKAVVYEFDPTNSTFTSVLSFPLTYKKGATNNDKTDVDRATYWLPWTDVVPGSTAVPSRFARADLPNAAYPQPWLTGIEFDVDGAMILSIRDRTGDQFGNNNYGPANTTQYRVIAPGDLLRAGKCSPTATQWTMESNATVCGVTSLSGANNGQGFGNGEYYYSDAISQPSTANPFHLEMSEGGLALLMGSGDVSSVVLDPTDQIDAGGIRRFKNSDGSSSPATSVQIYQSTDVATYGKANGLGDIELSFDPAPIEIGNRVWNDSDKDGLQDPGETNYTPVAGLTVQLLQGATVIATTTVSATGTYLFSSASTTAIQPNTAYQVKLVIPTSTSLLVTSTASGIDTALDSDASLAGVVSLTTGNYGVNDHTYDIGVFVCTNPTGTTSFTNATCFNGVPQPLARIAVTAITNATQVNISPGGTYTLAAGFNDPTNQTVVSAATSFTGLSSGSTYTVRLFNGATNCFQDYVVTIPVATCCGISLTNVVTGACSTTNNQFTTTGTVRLSNVPVAGTLFISNGVQSQTVAVTTSTTAVSFTFVAESDGTTRTISTSLASCGTATTAVVSPSACFVACATSCSTVSVTNYNITADAVAQFKYQTLSAETRYGNNATDGTHELDFNRITPATSTVSTGQYTWTSNTPNSFTFAYNPSLTGQNRAVFTLSSGSQTVSIQTNPQSLTSGTALPLQFNAIQLSAQASSLLGATVDVTNLALNGNSLGTTLSASSLVIGNADNAILRSSQLNQAFVLTGTITYTWLFLSPPPADGLSVNLRLGVVNDCAVIPVTTVNSATIACQATSTTLTATSSQTGLTYRWSGPGSFTANTQSVTATATGTYTVVSTNPTTGCSSTTTATVTQNPSVTVSVSALPGNTICQGTSVTLTASASGGSGFTYTWSPVGTGTSQSVIVSPTSTTPYTVTVTNSNGCSAVATATVTVNPAVTATVANQTICNGTSATLTATASGGTGFTYAWSPVGTGTSQTVVVSPTATTPYTVTVTNSNGCSATATATVTVNPAVTAVITASPGNTICNGTSATLTATGGSAYLWSTGASTAAITVSPTSTTAYSVTVINSNSCSAITATTITVNPAVTATVANQTICNGTSTTLTATASGGSGFTYNWSPAGTGTSQTVVVSPTTTTLYSVTVTNSNGCSTVSTATVTVNPAVTAVIAVSPSNTICNGTSATLTASGGTAYRWSTGATTAAITVSPTSTTAYSVTVTNASNCSAVTSATVTVNPAVTATVANQTICNGTSATLTANASGGSGFTYTWSPVGTGSTQSVVVSPTATTPYTVTVTNSNGCSAIATATVTVNAAVTATVANQTICNGISATLTATASGGTGFTYTWSPAGTGTTQSVVVAPSATTPYTVTVTNSNGCSVVATATVTVNPAVTATVANQTICNGTSATLTANASGGSGFTYAWSPAGTGTSQSVIVSPTSTTPYTVTVTNSNGCSTVATATVTVNPAVTAVITASPGNTICNGTSATLTASGGTAYRWSTGATTAAITVSPTSTTAYSVTVTNGTGCSAVTTATITVNPAVTATVANSTICSGTSTTLTVTASGGTGFTYTWSPTGTGTSQSVVVSPTATTPYTVTVTNSNGCSAIATATVTVNSAVTAVVTASPGNTICNGTSATLTASGGSAYLWSTGATTAAITVSPTSTTAYSVTVTSGTGCSAVTSATVTVNPAVTATVANQTICYGTSTTLTANASGGTGFTYTWSPTGTGTLQTVTVAPLVTTAYTVTVTNNNGCSAVATAIVTVNPAVTATVSNQTICPGTSATLTANAAGGTGFTYSWSPVGTGTSQTVVVSPAATTTYSVTVTNNTSCSTVATATVTVNPSVTATLSSATICTGNSATLIATGGVSYRFGPGNTNTTGRLAVSPTTIGTNPYSVTVTSAEGCTAVANATVVVNSLPQPTISGNATLCAGQPISLTASPTTGLTYAWSGPGGSLGSANPLTIANSTSANSGTYQVLVTNTNGCTATATYNVTVKPVPVVQILNTSITCANNQPAVAISTQVTGGSPPISYAWYRSGAAGVISTSPNPSFSTPDTYSLLVTDASGCQSNTATVTVMTPDPLAVNTQTANALCFNAQGRITVTTSGGMAPYTVRYFNSGGLISTTTTSGVSTLQTVAGSYTIIVADANGCSLTQTATITQPPVLAVTLTSGGPVCAGQTTGTIASSVTGGTSPYSYSWSTGATTANVSSLSGGSYSVVVTDANGCVTAQTITIATNPLPNAPTVSVTQPTCVTLTGTIQVLTPASGVQYSFNNGISYQVSPTQSGLQPDVYQLRVKDNTTGCVSLPTSVTINPVPSPPVPSIAGNTVYCAGNPISLTASPTTGVTYVWSGPAGSLGNANPLVVATTSVAQSGVYRVTVTDVNGCTATASATITVNPAVTAVVTNQSICAGLSATLTASGGTDYRWSTGATSPAIVVAPTATMPYTVTVTNASNCSAIATGTVTVNQAITATVNSATLTCQTPVATLSVTSSQTGLAYQWSGPNGFAASTQSVTVVNPGTYTVVASNVQTGCATTTTTTVAQVAGVDVTLFTQSNCLNNGTDATATDDYFTVTIQATNGTPGISGRYDVVLGADATGLGGTVLNPGGTSYGTSATVGGVGQPNARGFLANGSSIYSLTIRDSNNTSANTGCRTARLTGQVNPCSSCLPPLCQPARIRKQ
ncbi:SdrD B-like domain-containing protein [uncultured Fibrella sp.]|uniref:SdrD B-like domain-containing protein n=1 Tax=uncultured Fibrella sp. TaxID=1284596 RepID=UPI0035C943BB